MLSSLLLVAWGAARPGWREATVCCSAPSGPCCLGFRVQGSGFIRVYGLGVRRLGAGRGPLGKSAAPICTTRR